MAELAKNQLHTVTVTGYTAEGLGVARIDGRVAFIHGGVREEAGGAAGPGLSPLPCLRRL